ncbi:hypothetical protein ME790_01770 [Lactobacillus delbrueckii]|uniref:hypothetical protein n=1 Tax=Lactobacillus delbrueckii TaxID=1584 RepID=UPI001F45A4C4|nr:hypothetical protein [Lactobacillus delbrueckii]GHN31106.1 hypothetical protein ME790_01770 [Lactobacillus delbrueckii]
MNVKKVPPRWQRLGFSSEEDMNEHEAIYKRRKAQIDHIAKIIAEARWLDSTHRQAKKEKEN